VHGHGQAISIAYVTDEEPHSRVVTKGLLHFELLEFISGIDRNARRVLGGQQGTDEGLAE